MKNIMILFFFSILTSFTFAAGSIDLAKADKVIPKNLPETLELESTVYRVINFDPGRFIFDWSKNNIKRGDYLFLDGLVYQVYDGSWVGIGIPDHNWYGIWWDIQEYVSLNENDHVRVYGKVKEVNGSVGTGHIDIIKIEKLE